jgi:hypothetical protein
MRHIFRAAALLIAFAATPATGYAGWQTTWKNTAVNQAGDKTNTQNASMAIAGGRVRLEQPEIITLIDYNTEQFTLINPTKRLFWSGTVDEYMREMGRNRAQKMSEQFGEAGQKQPGKKPDFSTYQPPKVDPAKLPPLSISKTGQTETIAGYETEKYQIIADGTLFQEIWVAPLDVSGDLDPARYLAVQRKMSSAMLGKAADQYNALYLNEEYQKLLAKAFILKIVTHHMAGGFERSAVTVEESDVPASTFSVPETYRKVRLSDVIETPAAAPAARPAHPAPKGS